MAEQFGPSLLLIDRLAVGGMAEVYRGKQLGIGGFEKTVAIKRILPHFNTNDEFKEMFLRELTLCAELQHPNIAQLFGAGEERGYLYSVMEFIDGKNLSQLLSTVAKQHSAIPIEICCYIICETAKGLNYAHHFADPVSGKARGIIHRDISPHNVMLSYGGEVKIVDFGIAKATDRGELTRTGILKGKVPYMSPEQVEGLPIDQRSDIFSLGIVFYELLAMRDLFVGESTMEIMRSVRECIVPPIREINPNLDSNLERILTKVLCKDRDQRYQAAADLERDLTIHMNEHYVGLLPSDVSGYLRQVFATQISQEQCDRQASDSRIRAQSAGVRIASQAQTELIDSAPAKPRVPWLYLSFVAVSLLTSVAAIYLWATTTMPSSSLAASSGQMLGWYSADHPQLAAGDTVSSWNDRSPSRSELIQSNPERRPVVKSNRLNGKPTLVFDGKDDFLESGSIAKALRSATGATIIYVSSAVPHQRGQYIFALQGSSRTNDLIRAGYGAENRLRIKFNNAPASYQDSHLSQYRGFAIYSAVFERSLARMYQNGKKVIEAPIVEDVPYTDATYASVGQEWDPVGPSDLFEGDLAELMVFSRPLSNEERQELERAMSLKYQLPLTFE